MDTWGRDLEEALHVRFSGRPAFDSTVGVDERQVLPLLVRELNRRDRHGPHDLIRSLLEEERMNVRYIVALTDEERAALVAVVSGGSKHVRNVKRAQILLAADAGVSDEGIAASVHVGTATVFRTKRRFVESGPDAAIRDLPRPGAGRKLTGKEEALLIATACTDAPAGRSRWTLELLAGEVARLTGHDSISRETVRRRLSENKLKPWQKKMWCVPKVDAEFVARMEDVLDLYAEPLAEDEPVVCFDESPVQLIGETRVPKPCKPGQPARIDYEYRRNGIVNLLVFVDAHEPWRHVDVADTHTANDFAHAMRDLVDVHYPSAKRIHVVLDNYGTHSMAALYQTFAANEARRIAARLQFHFVPKHASWLNMAEIEIGVVRKQCLDRRIEQKAVLAAEVATWEHQRNASGARVRWMFSVEKARVKMAGSYPKPALPTRSRPRGIEPVKTPVQAH
jgi:transposase